jgi:hypothetical protein
MINETDEIELAGENSYLNNENYQNPYKLYSDEFNRYERGWTQAMKKVSVGLLTQKPGQQKNEFPLKYPREKEPVYRQPINLDKAEQYRNRKG